MIDNNNKGLKALETDINKNIEILDAQRGERKHNKEMIILQSMVDKVECKNDDLMQALSQKGQGTRTLKEIITNEIVRVIDDNLTVPNYTERAKAEQIVYLFSGMNWMELDRQMYKDFVNDAAKKCGTPDIYLHDYKFMNNVYEQVAFIIAKSRNPFIPSNETRINVMNGTLTIKDDGSVTLREHNRDDFFLYTLDYHYDPNAECPMWHKFLDQMLPDKGVQAMLASYIAYCFTRSLKLEKMLVLYGGGSNGKSVVLDVLEALFGIFNISNISLADLTNDDEKRLHINNKLVNISHESNKELDPSVLKRLVSGEPIDARQLYVGTLTIRSYAKFITNFNVLPTAEATHGFYRRFIIIPFEVTIDDKDADVDLARKLRKELPGILNWVLEALVTLMKERKFPDSEVCKQALDNYKLNSDSVRLFIHEMCEVSTATTSSKYTYEQYKNFCSEEGLHALGRNNFQTRFESCGFKPIRKQRNKFYYVTINRNE